MEIIVTVIVLLLAAVSIRVMYKSQKDKKRFD